MHRILLIITTCFCFLAISDCRPEGMVRQIDLPTKEFPYTKRLPFIANLCKSNLNFLSDSIYSIELVSIWDDGQFRNQILAKEPYDAIEDLNIYHSHDYFWELLLIPYLARFRCNEYHITGYLLYYDPITKQKLTKSLEKKRNEKAPDLPLMLTREYQLVNLELAEKQSELNSQPETPFFGTKYTTTPDPKDPFSQVKVWAPKPKSEIQTLPEDRLFNYCLDFPYECVTDTNYFAEMKKRISSNRNTNSHSLANSFHTNLNREKDKTYFRCYCRKEPNLSIYKTCPIDQFGLDSICKEKFDCLHQRNDSEKKFCYQKYKEDLATLLKTKEPKYKIDSDPTNEERMIHYTKKFWAMEVLGEISE